MRTKIFQARLGVYYGSMAYISLYRKYRPQTFEDVVGQEHVTTTLRNAISAGRVASGYLFTGTRGTAKTTCARILAKALNCIGPKGDLTNPTPEPCGVCGPCKSIASSSFVDVLEMDAASHGKVDDVRDLVASIKFPPMEGRYKVYIIDEAHQLSRDAMDAFLKTLEEPPDRVVFVLATTELEKLPITIASRCQVYEFKRGSVAQISARVTDVLQAEGVKADAGAVTLIARAADGSYRDSLSLLEQVLAYQRVHVTVKDVTVVLGTIDEDVLRQVVELIADSDAAGAFGLTGTVLESGKDVRQFLRSLADRFRDMLFVGVGAVQASAGDLDDSQSLRTQASRFAPADLLKALEVLTAAEQETKRSNQHRLILEMALLKLMRLPSQAAPPAPYVSMPVPVAVPPTPNNGEIRKEVPALLPVVEEAVVIPEAVAVPYEMPPPLDDAELSDLAGDEDEEAAYTLLPGDEELDELPSAIVVSEDGGLLAEDFAPLEALALDEAPPEELPQEDLLQVQQVAFEAPPPLPAKLVQAPDAPPELLRLRKSWQEVVNLTGAKSKAAAKDMTEAVPIDISGNVVTLEFAHPFHYERVQGKEALREFIAESICRTLDVDLGTYRVKCIMAGQVVPQRPTQNGTPQNGKPQSPVFQGPTGSLPPDTPSPFVQKVIAVFGGELLEDDAN